jgi:hypothetical protein
LLICPVRGAVTEEPDAHEDWKNEDVVEEYVVPALEEEQQIEAVKQEGRPENGIPYPACRKLAPSDARHPQHRGTAKNEEQDIDIEHVGTPSFALEPPTARELTHSTTLSSEIRIFQS